ncbi:MAG: M17 family metallopeptidase [Planctomycetota bacterium]
MALNVTLHAGAPGKSDLLVCYAVPASGGGGGKSKAKAPAKAKPGHVLGKGVPAHVQAAVNVANFEGNAGQTLDVVGRPGEPAGCVLVVGLGAVADLGVTGLLEAGGTASRSARRLKVSTFDVAVPDEVLKQTVAGQPALAHLLEGMLLGNYRHDMFTKPKGIDPAAARVWLAGAVTAAHKDALARAQHADAGVELARTLVTTPANDCTPTHLANTARGFAKAGKGAAALKVTIIEKAALQKGGYGGILGVNLGSDLPPYLCIMHYDCGKKGAPTVCFVGKGITFDTGGYSIKTMPGMAAMKQDMAGGGAVLGLMHAVRHRQPAINVVGVVPTTENMINGKAYRPSDVLHMYDGTTVEVGNTDAEGRLILADALAHATKHIKPDVMFDYATLTGACMVALGGHAAGLMSDDDKLADEIYQVATDCGERVWRLPVWDQYKAQLESKIADLYNIGGPGGGACTAGAFLKHFVDTEAIRYAHIDIAGTAWSDKGNGWTPPGATGFGVRLGLAIIDHFENAKPAAAKKKKSK